MHSYDLDSLLDQIEKAEHALWVLRSDIYARLDDARQAPFTRARAIADARAKAATFGDLARTGLDSLIKDWERAL